MLQVSKGFDYTWDPSRPVGQRVGQITIAGVPVDPAASYGVAMNNFLAKHSPVAPAPLDRITVAGGS